MEMKLKKWELKGIWIKEVGDPNNLYEYGGVTPWIDAEVPGSVQTDLLKAGLIEDPYFGMNSIKCEWVENRWWVYRTKFTLPAEFTGRRNQLVLRGLDYEAMIFINGHRIGHPVGMYVEHRFDIDAFLSEEGENTLHIVVMGVPDEISMYGASHETKTQKCRFAYVWDFATRLVNIGLYDEVVIESFDTCRLEQTHIRTVHTEGGWSVRARLDVRAWEERQVDFILSACGREAATRVSLRPGVSTVGLELPVESPELWWPNGHGGQPLYSCTVSAWCGQTLCDEKTYRIGFRTLSYRQTDGAPQDAIPYNVVVNGKRIYLKGVNIVPLDQLYGSVDEGRYRRLLEKARDAHVNAIRVWGGGLIEKEVFYELCDEMGILVWQDFTQSGGFFGGYPSEDPDYLALLRQTAVFAVRQKRNHVCLAYWCGGNELGSSKPDYNWPSMPASLSFTSTNDMADFAVPNIAMLTGIVKQYDPDRLMLPTTASGSEPVAQLHSSKLSHDVHGPWLYCGVKEHYESFNRVRYMLHSEMGCNGMSSLETLKRILPPDKIGVRDSSQDYMWRHHCIGWDTYPGREQPLFGEFADEELETLIKCSQVLQAEGVRYMLESDRRRMFECCGSLVWQLNEPWPNIACTSLVEYYGTPKLAYWLMKAAFQPVVPTARYGSLIYERGSVFAPEIFLTNELGAAEYTVTCRCVAGAKGQGRVLAEKVFHGKVPENASVHCGKLEAVLDLEETGFMLELIAECNGEWRNRYLMLMDIGNGRADRKAAADFYDMMMGK